MARLLEIEPARQALERRRADLAGEAARAWRRSWQRVYAECIGLFVLGYVLYGASWGLGNSRQADLLVAGSWLVSYVLPLWRLLAFFLRHADQF